MTPPDDAYETNDQILIDHLRRVLNTVDPVPPALVAQAQGAFIHRSADTQLAHLLEEELVGVRGSEELLLTFTGSGVTLNLTDDEGSLIGHVSPPHSEVTLESAGNGTTPVSVDDVGRFNLEDVSGPIRFHIQFDDQEVVTFWVTI